MQLNTFADIFSRQYTYVSFYTAVGMRFFKIQAAVRRVIMGVTRSHLLFRFERFQY